MTRLRDTMHEITREAPPIGGSVARRAVARARRRRFAGIGGSAAGLAVAGVTATALVVTGLPGVLPASEDGNVTAASGGRTGEAAERIELPEATPDPLPASGVGFVEVAYTLNCRGVPDRVDCATWRVLTADGRHWRVGDAMPPEIGERNGLEYIERRGALAVSPQGDRLAYLREDGSFVIRDLAGGEVTPVFTVSEGDLGRGDVEVRWSPDGRRVAVHHAYFDWESTMVGDEATLGGNDPAPPAMVVDTETMEAIALPSECCLVALPPGDQPVLMEDNDSDSEADWTKLLVLGPDGRAQEMLPFEGVYWLRSDAYSPEWSRISPDGESLAGITMVDEGRKRYKGDTRTAPYDPHLELLVIDPSTGELGARHRLPASFEGPTHKDMLGWADASNVLVAELPGDGFDALLDEGPAGWHGSDVYAVNVETGQVSKALEFGETKPALLSLATDLP